MSRKHIAYAAMAIISIVGWNAFVIQRDARMFKEAGAARACEQLKVWHPDCKQ